MGPFKFGNEEVNCGRLTKIGPNSEAGWKLRPRRRTVRGFATAQEYYASRTARELPCNGFTSDFPSVLISRNDCPDEASTRILVPSAFARRDPKLNLGGSLNLTLQCVTLLFVALHRVSLERP